MTPRGALRWLCWTVRSWWQARRDKPVERPGTDDQFGEWLNCTPQLLAQGIDCAATPRRPGHAPDDPGPVVVSHQHLVDLHRLNRKHEADEDDRRWTP